jgi:hypothetical protein
MASVLLGSKRFPHLALVAQTQPWRLEISTSSRKWLEAKKLNLQVHTFTTGREPALQLGNPLHWLIRMQR